VEDKFDISKIYEMLVPGDYLITFQCRQPTVTIADKTFKRAPDGGRNLKRDHGYGASEAVIAA